MSQYQPRRAEDILQDLSITKPGGIDLEAIAWMQGAKVKYRSMDGCDACILGHAEKRRAIISVNENSSERRQKFSLSHELGHWEWHRGQQLYCGKEDITGSGKNRQAQSKEATANRFAAEMLMPQYMIRPMLRDFPKFTMNTVTELANEFGVSKTAMAFRLVEIEFEPSLLIAHGPEGRRWFIRSKSIAEKWFPSDRLDPQSNAHEILHKGTPDDRFMSTTDGDSWFDAHGADWVNLGEQSYKTSDDEVLTLLVAKSEKLLAD